MNSAPNRNKSNILWTFSWTRPCKSWKYWSYGLQTQYSETSERINFITIHSIWIGFTIDLPLTSYLVYHAYSAICCESCVSEADNVNTIYGALLFIWTSFIWSAGFIWARVRLWYRSLQSIIFGYYTDIYL